MCAPDDNTRQTEAEREIDRDDEQDWREIGNRLLDFNSSALWEAITGER